MPVDPVLVERIRELLAAEVAVTERRMFGGVAFLVRGNLAVAASHTGGLLVRMDPRAADRLLGRAHVAPMEMGGRTMAGWLRVEPDGVRTARQLGVWVRRGVALASALPAKDGRRE